MVSLSCFYFYYIHITRTLQGVFAKLLSCASCAYHANKKGAAAPLVLRCLFAFVCAFSRGVYPLPYIKLPLRFYLPVYRHWYNKKGTKQAYYSCTRPLQNNPRIFPRSATRCFHFRALHKSGGGCAMCIMCIYYRVCKLCIQFNLVHSNIRSI